MAHTTACRAHAIGCAEENTEAMRPGLASLTEADPVAEGDGCLADATVTCLCHLPEAAVIAAAPQIVRGLAVLDQVAAG